jgi:nitrite reductase/ring-hydroxylating ferredoxin subunit
VPVHGDIETPRRWLAAAPGGLPAGERRAVDCDGATVVVFNVNGEYVAWENSCPHQGGPICDGHVTGTLTWDPETGGPVWLEDPPILVCPWHGIEFDLYNGVALCGIEMSLRRWPIEPDAEGVWVIERS